MAVVGILGCAGWEVVVWWGAVVVGIDPVVAGQIPVGGGGRRQRECVGEGDDPPPEDGQHVCARSLPLPRFL